MNVVGFIVKKKLIIIVTLVILAGFIGYINAPGILHINCNYPDFLISIDNNSPKRGGDVLLSNGKHTVIVTKPGYYPIKNDVNVGQLNNYTLSLVLQPKSLMVDLENNPVNGVRFGDNMKVEYCDRLKAAACIVTKSGGALEYNDSLKVLKSNYLVDKSLPLIFNRDSSSGDVIIYQSNEFTIKSTAPDNLDRPVFIVIQKTTNYSVGDVNEAIAKTLGNQTYPYYLQFLSDDMAINNTTPSDSTVYWNDYGE